ncbi:MAG TPA: prepilin-type N-terminal cleavage/methylation domain-containing protein [Gemmatimonadaceae bacterium]|nr:prepilin-type N-terminal cleavage/methylation domain-containing protein [Gemmatimonadaceae bacterium]
MRAGVRSGVTLIELIVVLAILGVMAGVVGVAVRGAGEVREADARMAQIQAARSEAIRTGHPIRITIRVGGLSYAVSALPDGRVIEDRAITDRSVDVDRWNGYPTTGRVAAAASGGSAYAITP